MKIHVPELTTAIIFGYLDAILKECIRKSMKFLLDNGRNFIFSGYVTGNFWHPPSPEIFVTVCHGSRDPFPPPPLFSQSECKKWANIRRPVIEWLMCGEILFRELTFELGHSLSQSGQTIYSLRNIGAHRLYTAYCSYCRSSTKELFAYNFVF